MLYLKMFASLQITKMLYSIIAWRINKMDTHTIWIKKKSSCVLHSLVPVFVQALFTFSLLPSDAKKKSFQRGLLVGLAFLIPHLLSHPKLLRNLLIMAGNG